ncbi:MAG: glycosyltransferase family 4 protein, partial [Actinomycetota bacterium]|nr:glycosyltransferase family 4 protein [Actinomycetota bacterium]
DPHLKVRKIASHFAPPPVNNLRKREQVREILGFSSKDFVVGKFGYMTANKRLDVILRAIKEVKRDFRIKLLVVGKLMPGCDSTKLIYDLGLDDDVLVTGFVDRRTFWEYLRVPDVCVALRYPSAGETSAIVIKMMGNGCPVIISDYQAFSEFPGDCCRKVAPGEKEIESLSAQIVELAENPSEREEIGKRARKYIERNHDIRDSARKYIEFAVEILSGKEN